MNSIITFLVAMLFSAVTVVDAFDNVVLQVGLMTTTSCNKSTGPCCDKNEWAHIQDKFYTMVSKQRQLRGSDAVDEDSTLDGVSVVGNEDRELKTYPRFCASRCAGWAAGTCLAAYCKGFRRSLVESIRELFWSTNCDNQKSEVNNLFKNMANNNEVGPRCKQVLQGPRSMECYSNVNC